MNRLIKTCNIPSLLKNIYLKPGVQWSQGGVRTVLSSAFSLRDEWSKRLDEPLIKNIKLEDFTYELDRKFNRDGKLSAIDVDLFVHKCTSENDLELIEEMVYRLRRCPNTVYTLPSTGHALVRLMLEYNKHKDIVRILDDRVNYGVFPDEYCYILLMDTFLKEKNYTYAARVASLLMLQEDFGNMLCKSMALYSCHMYIHQADPHPWEVEVVEEAQADKAEEQQEEDEEYEDQRVRVNVIREPYFDDHFDLKESKHVIGKTLAFLGKEFDGPLGRSYQLIGFAMYRKWDHIKNLTNQWISSSDEHIVLKDAVKLFETEIGSVKDENRRATLQNEFADIIKKLQENSSKETLAEQVKKLLDNEIASSEQENIKQQKGIYESWEKRRQQAIEHQIQASLRKQIVQEIRQKKKAVQDEEEMLYFFENFEQHALKLPSEFQPEIGPEEPLPKYRPKPDWHIVNVEEDYQHGLFMPPDELKEKFTEATVVPEIKEKRKRR